MSLLRALSTSKSRRGGYDRLLDETNDKNRDNNNSTPVLKRAFSVPARVLFGSSSRKINSTSSSSSFSFSFSSSESRFARLFKSSSRKPKPSSSLSETELVSRSVEQSNNKPPMPQQEKKTGGKIHPVFGLFDERSWSKRKFTSNPEFSRYVDYLKESGGMEIL